MYGGYKRKTKRKKKNELRILQNVFVRPIYRKIDGKGGKNILDNLKDCTLSRSEE